MGPDLLRHLNVAEVSPLTTKKKSKFRGELHPPPTMIAVLSFLEPSSIGLGD